MGSSANDDVPLGRTHAKSDESDVPSTGVDRPDNDRPLERERIHLLLIEDAWRGLADIAAGRTYEADEAIGQLQQRRAIWRR